MCCFISLLISSKEQKHVKPNFTELGFIIPSDPFAVDPVYMFPDCVGQRDRHGPLPQQLNTPYTLVVTLPVSWLNE